MVKMKYLKDFVIFLVSRDINVLEPIVIDLASSLVLLSLLSKDKYFNLLPHALIYSCFSNLVAVANYVVNSCYFCCSK